MIYKLSENHSLIISATANKNVYKVDFVEHHQNGARVLDTELYDRDALAFEYGIEL